MNELALNQTPVLIDSVEQANKAFSIANLIFHPTAMDRIDIFAANMAKAKKLLPSAFTNDPEACKSLLILAGSLNMNPYAIGKHAFVGPDGTIGFEAKVYQAIAKASAGITFDEEYSEGWERVVGKTIEKTGSGGGKYRAPNWTPADEAGLYMDLTGTWPDGTKKTLRVFMAQCHPRLSTNWANDPQLQTYYAGIKKWLRRYDPAVIMGIFDEDDFQSQDVGEKDITPQKQTTEDLNAVLNGSKLHSESQVEAKVKTHGETKGEPAIEDAAYTVASNANEKETQPETQNATQAKLYSKTETKSEMVPPSKFDEIKDFITMVNDKQGYKDAREIYVDAVNNDKVTQSEAEELMKMLVSLHEILSKPNK